MGVLFDLITFNVTGTVVEDIDQAAGQYRVVLTGEGSGVTQRSESTGIIRAGRFLPVTHWSAGTVRGRDNRSLTKYDYERGTIELHSRYYTLFLGRLRQLDDVLKIPAGQPVDDIISATLNFAANQLGTDAEGYYHTQVVRRAKAENEGPDEVSANGYRAELVPLRFRTPDRSGDRAAHRDDRHHALLGVGTLESARPGHLRSDAPRRVDELLPHTRQHREPSGSRPSPDRSAWRFDLVALGEVMLRFVAPPPSGSSRPSR